MTDLFNRELLQSKGWYCVQTAVGYEVRQADHKPLSGAPDEETAWALAGFIAGEHMADLIDLLDSLPDDDDEDWEYEPDDEYDPVCPQCNNLGGNRYDDGVTPCPLCRRP